MRGLVLAGGGAKGSYQIGVWKALRELDIEINVVCGTSIGAFNGAFFAQQQFDKAYNLWSNMTMNDLFEADQKLIHAFDKIIKEKKFPTNLSLIKDFYYYVRRSGGLNIAPLRRMIVTYLDEELLRKSPIEYGLVTVNLGKMRPLKLFVDDIPEGKLKHYLLGSAMVPGFARSKDDPIRFMDGGVYDNFPIKMAIDKGCDEVVAVSLGKIRKKPWDANVIYVEPKEDLGHFLHVEHERIHRNIRMGYLDCLQAFGHLEGHKHYFKNMYSENDIIRRLGKLPFELKEEITKILLDKELVSERFFFEKVIPKLAKEVDCNINCDYKEILIRVYEKLLSYNDEETIEVYSPTIVKHHLDGVEFPEDMRVYEILLSL